MKCAINVTKSSSPLADSPSESEAECASTATDDTLLARIREGDEAAFSELLRLHLGPIHAYLMRMTRSRADAEDLAQETFLRIWQKASAYVPGKVKATTWIHRIAHNLCVDGFRRHSGENRPVPEAKASGRDDGIEAITDNGSDPFLQLSSAETHRYFLTALGALPEAQRAAFVLCQMQGFSNAQAADIIGVKLRALESLLARARRTLRESVT